MNYQIFCAVNGLITKLIVMQINSTLQFSEANGLLPLCGKKNVNTQYRHVWEKNGFLGIHMFSTVYVRNAKKWTGASERKNLEPPVITDGFRGNTAKFYFVILKDCVSNS